LILCECVKCFDITCLYQSHDLREEVKGNIPSYLIIKQPLIVLIPNCKLEGLSRTKLIMGSIPFFAVVMSAIVTFTILDGESNTIGEGNKETLSARDVDCVLILHVCILPETDLAVKARLLDPCKDIVNVREALTSVADLAVCTQDGVVLIIVSFDLGEYYGTVRGGEEAVYHCLFHACIISYSEQIASLGCDLFSVVSAWCERI